VRDRKRERGTERKGGGKNCSRRVGEGENSREKRETGKLGDKGFHLNNI
jgi:hypothetical protein